MPLCRTQKEEKGMCDVTVSSASLSVAMKLGTDLSGHATLSVATCSFEIGHLEAKFRIGGPSPKPRSVQLCEVAKV